MKRAKQDGGEGEMTFKTRAEAKIHLFKYFGYYLTLLTPAEKLKLYQVLKKDLRKGTDVRYLKTLLFPEQYSYDIPFPLQNISYTRFTDKQVFTIDTGSLGSGSLYLMPMVNWGPSIVLDNRTLREEGAADITDYVHTNISTSNVHFGGNCSRYKDYFKSVCLVAASMSVQYLGSADADSGVLVGGHIHNVGWWNATRDHFENAYHKVVASPHEGIRLCYIPKDAGSFQFYPIITEKLQGSGIKTQQVIVNDEEFENYYALGQVYDFQTSTTEDFAAANQYADDYKMGFYWEGMSQSQKWLRVEINRKFNAIPLNVFRDFSDLRRPSGLSDPDQTINQVVRLANSAPIGGHTLKSADQGVIGKLKENLDNIDLVLDSGADFGSMSHLAHGLETANAKIY